MILTTEEIKQRIQELENDPSDTSDEIFDILENNNVIFQCENGCDITMYDADSLHNGTYECNECGGIVEILKEE